MTRENVLAMAALLGLFFVYAGDAAPAVNEAHYLVKAKNFWQPDWCVNDLFASSGKAHATFYWLFGWPTQFVSLGTTAWLGRLIGWTMLAAGLLRLTRALNLPGIASVAVAVVWIAGIDHGNLAGEWVVGGIEAKVPAYGLVLWGLADIVRRRWSMAWVSMGAASALHVLTGGWAVVAGMIAFWFAERSRWRLADSPSRFWTWGLFAGGALSLFGLIPAAAMSWGVSDAEQVSAARIYAYFRISHHLTPSAFHWDWYVRHGILTAVTLTGWGILVRSSGRASFGASSVVDLAKDPLEHSLKSLKILGWFGIGAMLITVTGLLVGVLPAVAPDLAAKLLRFYWFRLADAITPLVLALVVVKFIAGSGRRVWLGTAVVALASVLFCQSTWRRVRPGVPVSVSNQLLGLDSEANYGTQRKTFEDWIAVCQFIRASTPEDAVLLTPRHQQSFKWYAQRAEVVNWKDTPQDAASLREWAKRFVEVYPPRLSTMRVTIRYADLREMRRKYGCDWIVVDRRVVGPELPLVQIYPNAALNPGRSDSIYAVYELP